MAKRGSGQASKKNFERHVRGDRVKWIAVVVAILLLGVAVAAALTKGFTDANPYGWFDKKEAAAADKESGGLVVSEEGTIDNGISFSKIVLSPMQYASYGVEPTAEKAVVVQARVRNAMWEDWNDAKLTWDMSFEDPSSEWALGKSVKDYVQGVVSEDTFQYTISCSAPFGETIILQASVEGKNMLNGMKKVEYKQQFTGTYHGQFMKNFAEEIASFDFSLNKAENVVYIPFPSAADYEEFVDLYQTCNLLLTAKYSDVYTLACTKEAISGLALGYFGSVTEPILRASGAVFTYQGDDGGMSGGSYLEPVQVSDACVFPLIAWMFPAELGDNIVDYSSFDLTQYKSRLAGMQEWWQYRLYEYGLMFRFGEEECCVNFRFDPATLGTPIDGDIDLGDDDVVFGG